MAQYGLMPPVRSRRWLEDIIEHLFGDVKREFAEGEEKRTGYALFLRTGRHNHPVARRTAGIPAWKAIQPQWQPTVRA